MFKKIVYVTLVTAIFTITGCNTVKGLGKDVQGGGHAIEKSASH